jgi:cyclophilin family peptidyl-prolyl cis-trans isomerase
MKTSRLVLAMLVALAAPLACKKSKPPPQGTGDAAVLSSALASSSATVVPSSQIVAARVAADKRDPAEVPIDLASAIDPNARRASARALAQIDVPAAIERLGKALSDEDGEVVAWAAYGIAVPCDANPDLAREERDRIVHALAARVLTLDASPPLTSGAIDPWSAIAWGLGRCGGVDASRELARWLDRGGDRARWAAFALGSIAQHDRGLEDDVAHALVVAAQGGDASPPIDEALYPFGRGDWGDRPPVPGLGDVARARLSSTTARAFAIRALGRKDAGKPADLRSLLADASTPGPDLVEAIRALHKLGPDGDAEIAAFATRSAPVDDEKAAALVGDRYGALRVALELLADAPSTPTITTSLRAFLPKGAPTIAGVAKPTIARRVATLRCLAAIGLHPAAPGDAEIVHCAAHDASMPAPLAAELDALRDDTRLTALSHSDVTGERRELLLKLAKDGALRVRERAIAIFAKHPEADGAPELVVRDLGAKELGLVASAALALADRPSIAEGLSKKAIEDALDPSKPPQETPTPKKDLDASVKKALEGALVRPMEEADSEIEIDLAAAIAALRFVDGHAFLLRLCGDRSPAVRRAAGKALETIDGPSARVCETPTELGDASTHAKEAPAARTIELTTELSTLVLKLDPSIAPIAVARVTELASSGFYDGIVVHRVVPGFVVQFGDPKADGYGGAHVSLRCETAPVAFQPLDIGVALAGRDTGSSQLFVTLARTPHLDGSYAWLGRAEGDWNAVAEGDVILKAKVSTP